MSPRKRSPLTLEYILLGLLAEQPAHGYDLYKRVTSLEDVSMVWFVKQSKLYALLDKLEGDGLLSSTLVPGDIHPMRKEYQITAGGKKMFTTWRQSPVEHGRDMRQEFLARLYFARLAGGKPSMDLLHRQIDECTGWLQELQTGAEKYPDCQEYASMVYRFRIYQTEAMLNWLKECEKDFEDESKPIETPTPPRT